MNSYADVDNGIQLTPVAASGGPEPDSIADENEPPADPVVPQVKGSRLIKELDSQLHQTLDTVLAEAMARYIHEVYEPRLERVNIKDVLAGVDIGRSLVFPLELIPADIPNLLLIRNKCVTSTAVSNACKYGKPGVVKTIILYHECRNELEMLVINEPGHGHVEIIALGEDASGAVFAGEIASQPSSVAK
jgi:hypothetical protein